jgi:DNA polymerase-1
MHALPTHRYDFYLKYIVPFGECLTDIERKGMHVDLPLLATVERDARMELDALETQVLQWASRYVPEAHRLNLSSAAQKQQLLFAPYQNPKKNIVLEATKTFEVDNVEQIVEPMKKKPKKKREIVITGLGIPPVAFTASGAPAATAEVLQELAGQVQRRI